MLRKTWLSFFLFFFFSTAFSHAAFFDPKLHWKTLTTEHFRIHFYDGEQALAFHLIPLAEHAFDRLSKKLNWKPKGKIDVILTDVTDASNGLATVFPYPYILLFVAAPEGSSSLNYYDDWLDALMTHELTHIIHMDRYGGIAKPFRWLFGHTVSPNGLVPSWIREGLAVVQESAKGKGRNHNSFSEMLLRTDILNDQFLKMDEAGGEKTGWPAGYAPYIYGGSFWQYLADTYGEEKIAEFIKRYGDSLWLFSLNHKAKKTFGKNFSALWEEWKFSLKVKYEKEKERLISESLTPLKTLIHENEGQILAPTVSLDGAKLIYSKISLHDAAQIRLRDLTTGKDEALVKNKSADHFSFSPDGKKVVYSAFRLHKFFYYYQDLYEIDLETKKTTQLTTGARASDPNYSPDGKSIVYVGNKLSSTQLFIYDRTDKKTEQITHAPQFTRFSNPSFSSDGKQIVVSAWMKGARDLFLYRQSLGSIRKKELKTPGVESTKNPETRPSSLAAAWSPSPVPLTQNLALENEPRFSPDDQWVYYTSDQSGISNVYKLNVGHQNLSKSKNSLFSLMNEEKLTNVLTGLFHPQFVPKTGKWMAQHYFGRGYDIVEFEVQEVQKVCGVKRPCLASQGQIQNFFHPQHTNSFSSESLISNKKVFETQPALEEYKVKKYNPFPRILIPRSIVPGFFLGDGVGVFSLSTGTIDPVGYHLWRGDVTYRTDANFLGGNFYYSYNRWWLPLFVGFDDYVVGYGDLFHLNEDFFEERRRVYAGLRLPAGRHRWDLLYTFENRDAESSITPAGEDALNLGHFGGFRFSYQYDKTKKTAAAISPKGGRKFQLGLEVLDSTLGSSERNEPKTLDVDVREYLKIPGTKHHVLALRAAGGVNFGDKLYQGIFRLGSDIGEGFLSSTTSKLFPLRGLPQVTFAGDRALLFSGEYRMPLVHVDRGVGTYPFFLKDLHLGLFADLGSVFEGSPDWKYFLLGVGAEIRGDFILGYGLPITGRLGYGRIVKGREFLGNLEDPLTGSSIKNGTLILQIGTSF